MGAKGVWRGRGPLWRVGLVLVVVLVLAAGLVTAALVTDVDGDPPGVEAAPAVRGPVPGLEAATADAPAPDPAALDRILGPLADAPAAGDLTARVVDDATGQVLWERRPTDARVPASTVKLLTAVAALSRLPADARADTVLAEGTEPDTLVVVPGGDPTMSGGAEAGPLFPGAGTIPRAAEVVRSAGLRPARIVVDPGPDTGPALGPGWSPAEIAAGNIAPVQPWMLDGGRLDPADVYSPRSPEPMLAAGRALALALDLDPERVRLAEAPVQAGRELGRVPSASLTERLRSMLLHSDNVLAETLCREVALDRSPEQRADFAAGTAAVLETLAERGIDVSGVHLDDCSGMSPGNRVSAAVLTDVLRLAAGPDATREMRDLLDALPIAAATGTLADRYSGPAASGAGWVRAKTGTLSGTSALAGTVTSADGRTMSFALLSSGTNPADARPALDRIAAALRDCGCR